jgi:hypothetical protein
MAELVTAFDDNIELLQKKTLYAVVQTDAFKDSVV